MSPVDNKQGTKGRPNTDSKAVVTSRAAISIPPNAYEMRFIHASGPGGQHVNKTASAVELRVDVDALELRQDVYRRLLKQQDNRINKDGILVIQADSHRSQLNNRKDAFARLEAMVVQAKVVPKKRVPTRISKAAKKRRVNNKKNRGMVKSNRKKPSLDH